jgi:hypothetical protein
MEVIHFRVKPETLKALKQTQHEFIQRDRVPYNFNEVARYFLNEGLYRQGRLQTVPKLDGDGSTQIAKQAQFKQRIQKQLRRAAVR